MKSLEDLDEAFHKVLTKTVDVPIRMADWQQELEDFIQKEKPEKEYLDPYLEEWGRILRVNRVLLTEHQENLKDKLKIGDVDSKKTEFAKKYKH